MSAPDPGAVIESARDALHSVLDPELGIDIVSLGLVYDIRLDETGLVVEMTLTTPGCPVSELLPHEAGEALRHGLPQYPVRVDIVWDPPWSPERMSDDALVALGFRTGA